MKPANGIYLTDIQSLSNSLLLSMPLDTNGVGSLTTVESSTTFSLTTIVPSGDGNFYAIEYGTPYGSYQYPYLDVLKFGFTAAGVFTPLQRISQPSFPSLSSGTLAADAAGNVAVAGSNAVYIYAATANGTVTPTRSITGIPGTILQLAFDPSGNLYVRDSLGTSGQVLVYSPTANGAATPIHTLTPKLVGGLETIALDSIGDLFVVDTSDNPTPSGADVFTTSIYEYAPGADGNASPISTITPINHCLGFFLALDTTGALYLEANDDSGNGQYLKFAPGASGAATPISIAQTPATPPTTPNSPGTLDYNFLVVGP